jgi:hypothetical protein
MHVLFTADLFARAINKLWASPSHEHLPWLTNRFFLPSSEDIFIDESIYRIAASTLVILDKNKRLMEVGNGLFNNTGAKMTKSTYVGDFYGVILTNEEFEWWDKNCFYIDTGMKLNTLLGHNKTLNMVGVPRYPMSCINHDKENKNCYFKIDVSKFDKKTQRFRRGFISVYTLKEVESGDEFFADYGKDAMSVINCK